MQRETIKSKCLGREVIVDVILPRNYAISNQSYRLLVVNDGQDCPAIHLEDSILDLEASQKSTPIIAIAVHVGDRKQEYGVAGIPDFAKRGTKANDYAQFIENELFPWILSTYRILPGPQNSAMMGFSLGALSAFDLAWNHTHLFGCAGLFSGSFWWRARDLDSNYMPSDRIVLQMLEKSKKPEKPALKLWFQTGWMDEAADRDDDGLIDSIGDTLDLILALEKLGFKPGQDIEYMELGYGHHDHKTMAKVLPQFLQWFSSHK